LNARAILDECARRGIRLTAERGMIIARPKGATPPDLREEVLHYKAELLRLLASPWDADGAQKLLRETLATVEAMARDQSDAIRQRLADRIAEAGATINVLFLAQDLDALRYCLRDFERNVADAIGRRGYDNELEPAPCPICQNKCEWCRTSSILRCGLCYPPPRRKKQWQ
jgi:hypothetical protein